jgi:GxxExxY protein
MTDEYKYKEQTYKIIGAAIRVHKELGNGFQELIYQRALEIEFSNANLDFHREFSMPIIYRGIEIGTRRVDFLVNEIISVELKAVIRLEDAHLSQAINYLEAYNLEIGLLINFGSKSLDIKRLINSKYRTVPPPSP